MLHSELTWDADSELKGFEVATLHYPDDYDGKVTATLVRRLAPSPTKAAVLYIHGYVDYFFQAHLADAYNDHGYNFYALDLRKCGRSLNNHPHPHFCKDLKEYDAEINDAIQHITEDTGHDSFVLMGHSTGGLITSLYADEGKYKDRIDAMVLNSPFYDWSVPISLKIALPIVANVVAPLSSTFGIDSGETSGYMESITKGYHGEWEMNLDWRPMTGFPVFAGWVRAINKGHQKVKNGLNIQCPVLVMSSDKSILPGAYTPAFQSADTILDVAHIREGSKHLGNNVKLVQIKDGLHDLFLSRKDVREAAAKAMFDWLDQQNLKTSLATSEG